MALKKNGEWSRGVLIIGVFTLLAVGSWVGFEIYRSATKTTLPTVLQSQIQPLEPEVDQKLIDDLKSRQRYDETALSSVQSVAIEETTPTVSRVATSSAAVTPAIIATNAGEIQL